ncbi:MAG: DUF484 family protein [Burkholderiaceae bacterium]|nr:DUF484 family protein [Burkholderiaceae bacterium]
MSSPTGVQGITEADIANYLANTPGFFERHAELLSSIQLSSPHGTRAVSLQERQMDLLREKHKGLEQKIMEMIRHGQENVAIADRLHRYTRALMLTVDAADLPEVVVRELKQQFLIPQAGIRVWGLPSAPADREFAREVSADAKSFASSLTLPYCGANVGFEAASWLDDASTVASLAMIPLRHGATTDAFGLLVLGSPDATRFAADMGTEFLMRIGEIASAGLSRLIRAE